MKFPMADRPETRDLTVRTSQPTADEVHFWISAREQIRDHMQRMQIPGGPVAFRRGQEYVFLSGDSLCLADALDAHSFVELEYRNEAELRMVVLVACVHVAVASDLAMTVLRQGLTYAVLEDGRLTLQAPLARTEPIG